MLKGSIGAALAAVLLSMPSAGEAAGGVRTAGAAPMGEVAYQAYGPTYLVDVACPTTLVCLAIGRSHGGGVDGTSGYSMLYRSSDGGTTWVPDPVPGGAYSGYTDDESSVAVSCGSATFCALDYASSNGDFPGDFFEVSNDAGATWTPQGEVQYNGFPGLGMTDFSCTAPSTCVGILDGQIVSTTGGAWVTHTSSKDAVGADCASPRRCYVLEQIATATGSTVRVSWSANRGGTLTPLLTTHVAGSSLPPTVSCSSASACGVYVGGAEPLLFTTVDGGRHWSPEAGPNPTTGHEQALDCPTSNACTLLANDPQHPSMVESYTTTDRGIDGWQVVPVGQLGFVGAPLGLSCVPSTATACYATLGTNSVFDASDLGSWPSSWPSVVVSAGTPTLSAVACESDGGCLAIGDGVEATSTDDGHTWDETTDAALKGDQFAFLTCPYPSTCIASGTTTASSAQVGIVLLTSDLGASWTAAAVPWEVGDVGASACNSTTCIAIPSFSASLANVPAQLLRSTDSGLDWSLVTLAPATSNDVFTGVACPTVSSCIAVGSTYSPPQPGWNVTSTALVETSSDAGATWTQVAGTPSTVGRFGGLACTSSVDCVTSGATPGTGIESAYVTTDGGATWAPIGTMVDPSQSFSEGTTIEQCASLCTAISLDVGYYQRALPYPDVLVSSDGGATWTTSEEAAWAWVTQVAIAPDGTAVGVGRDLEGGPILTSFTM